MKKLIFIFLFSQTVTWAANFEIGLFSGYRSDGFNTEFINADTNITSATTSYSDLRSAVIGGDFQGDYKNFLLHFMWDYTWILSGKGQFYFPINDELINADTFFKSDVRGNLFDLFGFAGYEINCYKNKWFTFSFTPLGGYVCLNQTLRQKNIRPDNYILPTEELPPLITSLSTSADVMKLKQNWWGPNLGGDIGFQFFDRYRISGGYSYNWLDFKVKQELDVEVDFTFMGFDIAVLNRQFIDFKIHDAYAHMARGLFSFDVTQNLAFTLKGWYLFAKTKETKRDIFTLISGDLPPDEPTEAIETDFFKTKWHTYSLLLEGSWMY